MPNLHAGRLVSRLSRSGGSPTTPEEIADIRLAARLLPALSFDHDGDLQFRDRISGGFDRTRVLDGPSPCSGVGNAS